MKRNRFPGTVAMVLASVILAVGAGRNAAAQAAAPVQVRAQADTRVPASNAEVSLSFAPLVKKVAPAVVNIYAQRRVQSRTSLGVFDDPFFRRFFGDSPLGGFTRERMERSLGSGVIVGVEGLVVTNNHVIANAEEIKVVLADRREYAAELVMTDERTDIAVLRLQATGDERLPHIELGDSDSLEVGDLVLAVGNPFGVGQTVTSGIVSGLARTSVGVSDYRFFIQTDAAINPGNSGGALVGMDGRLVGVNTAIYSRSGGSLGIGFAVPANMIRTVLASAVSGKPLVRPWLSLTGRPVTSDIAQTLGLSRPVGVVVERVYPAGPAERAGVRPGDVVVAVAGHDVDDVEALRFRIATGSIGQEVALRVVRKGREQTVRFPLVAPPEEPPRRDALLEGRHPLAGTHVANLSPAVAAELGLRDDLDGVVILGLKRGSPAQRLGFQPNDVVREINGTKVGRVSELERLLDRPQDRWRMVILRGDREIAFEVSG